jgi:polar amino acid transport system substrate-binding protein
VTQRGILKSGSELAGVGLMGWFLRIAAVVLIGGITAQHTRADVLDDVRARGTLVWGADQEGGGPFVYPDPQDASKVTGFEVELAALLAKELGVAAQHYQADWNTLPSFLDAGKIDIILNGYEWTAERAAQMLASRPYYIYELQLLARQNDDRITSWESLRKLTATKRPSISVLGGSSCATYLREHWAGLVDIVEYDGNTNAMMQVASAVHDATLQDLPIAVFYREHPACRGLHFVDKPVSPGYYVAFARKGEARLVAAVNAAILRGISDGRLESIYEKYGIWNSTQQKLASAELSSVHAGQASRWEVVRRCMPVLLKSAGMTVLLSCAAMPIAVLLGLLIALGRLYGPAVLRGPLTVYVEVLRGTPVMLQLFVIFFLLPQVLPFSLNPVVASIVGLAINYSAYEAEIYRAGLLAIPRGQMEAALALGMAPAVALRRVIVPQAVRIVLPPVTNDFIALFKDTSICSVIAVTELTKQYNMLANSTGAIIELATITALLYLMMSYPLSLVARRMERRLAVEAERI